MVGRKPAGLWDYAVPDRLNATFKCNFCFDDFKGGVARLRYHLSGIRGGSIRICSKVSEEAKNDALLSLNVVNKKRKTEASSSDTDGGSSDICDPNCKSEVGYSVAKFFLMAGINHNMVESSSFTNLVNALRPGSALPSSLELESKLIPSFKTEVEQYVSGAKQSWIETGCTLIPIFELNEKEGKSFLSIFGCSRERTVLLNTFEVPTNIDLVAPNFFEETVCFVVQSVGSHNIVQCVVDGSQYGDYFSRFLGHHFPHVSVTKCAAHELQLLFEEICRDVGWVGTTFIKIKSIVDYIFSDTAILALMSKYANGKELKQSLGVNFLSSYKMLESILEVKKHLVQLVQSPEWLASGYGVGQHGSEVKAYIEDPKTWELGEKAQKGLRSLSQVLHSVNFHDSSSGYLYGLMEIAEHSISQLRSNDRDMYQRLWDLYILKKGKILNAFHSVAAFLNPTYMRTEQAKNVDRNPVITYILERFIAEGDREDFVNEVYEYMKILSDGSKLYESTAAKAYHHPCQWWETFGQKLTILRNLATRILSQPCSTSTCKSSMRTVEAVLVKEHRELSQGIMIDLDLKMNAILMERFDEDKAGKREKIVLEEFSKHRSNNGESNSRPLRQLKLRFTTEIASPIRTSQNVEGEKGRRIHAYLEDPTTGRVVHDGIPASLPLTISVLDGYFSNEASSDEHSTREYFNRNELSGECPYITGDLEVTLIRGEATLGNFSFNYSSVDRESGQFKLAIKTHTGVCGGFRILEGISNAFTVEDAEEVSPEPPVRHVDPQNSSFSSNPEEYWVSNTIPLIDENEYGFPLGQWIDTPYYPQQGFDQSLAQTAARRVKKKALTWHLQSRDRPRKLKRESQALKRKSRWEDVLKPRREVYSTGSNNVNGQEDNEENDDETMELEEVDSLTCCSTSAVARDSGSPKPEGPTMTLFGAKVSACSSSAEPVRETPSHPSTALQLSISTRGNNNAYHQKEDGKIMALKDFAPQLHSTSIKKRKVPRYEEPVFSAMHLPDDTIQGEMSHRISYLMDNSDHASMRHHVIGQKTRQAHIRWLKVKAVMIWWTVVRRAAARRKNIQHDQRGEEDDVHKSTTMSMKVRQHSRKNQQVDRKRLKEALQECSSKEDFHLHYSDSALGSINPMSDSLTATYIPLQITTNGVEPTKEDDMPVQIESCEQVKMDSSDFIYSVTPLSLSIGQHDNEDNPSAFPDSDLKLFRARLCDNSSQKVTTLENLSHCALPGLDLNDEGTTDYACMTDVQASKDFAIELSSTSSTEKNKDTYCRTGTTGKEMMVMKKILPPLNYSTFRDYHNDLTDGYVKELQNKWRRALKEDEDRIMARWNQEGNTSFVQIPIVEKWIADKDLIPPTTEYYRRGSSEDIVTHSTSSQGNKAAVVKGAYWPSLSARTFPSPAIGSSLFAHIYYAFLTSSSATYAFELPESDVDLLSNFIKDLQSKSTRIDSDSSLFANMASTRLNRKAFIDSSIKVARRFGFDGLDLDWEFPENPKQTEDYGLLLKEWRAAITIEGQALGRASLLGRAQGLGRRGYFSGFSTNGKYCGTGDTEVETSSKRERDDSYDIFMSYRAVDTRLDYPAQLYRYMIHKGIDVFKDDAIDVLDRAVENWKMGTVKMDSLDFTQSSTTPISLSSLDPDDERITDNMCMEDGQASEDSVSQLKFKDPRYDFYRTVLDNMLACMKQRFLNMRDRANSRPKYFFFPKMDCCQFKPWDIPRKIESLSPLPVLNHSEYEWYFFCPGKHGMSRTVPDVGFWKLAETGVISDDTGKIIGTKEIYCFNQSIRGSSSDENHSWILHEYHLNPSCIGYKDSEQIPFVACCLKRL